MTRTHTGGDRDANATGTVVLDTNALMMPVECDVRVFDELERVLGAPVDDLDLVVPAVAVAELDRLADGAGEAATAARVGRDLADRCRVVETDASYADDAVVEVATRGADDRVVVTNDRPLRDRLLDRGVRVAGLRGRNELAVNTP
ncbi:MAG: PIN domain-containing protein [Haloferacaceae archaeon]